jgi:hypothetical protein
VSTSWFEQWHGNAKIPADCIEGLSTTAGGGSTAMSTGVTNALSTKASVGHTHPQADVTNLVSTLAALSAQISTKAAGTHTHDYEPANANIQTHIASAHAPSNAQKNSDILKAEIEAVLTGQIDSHSHAGGAGGGIPSTWAVTSTHVLTGSTTMQSVTGLSFPVSSASVYRFEFTVAAVSSVLTCGVGLGLNGPASPLTLAYEWMVSTGIGGGLVKTQRAFGVQNVHSLAVDSTSAQHYGYLGGIVRTGASAGTLQMQFASEVAGSTVSIRAGSVGLLFGPL